jgi:hypothetical protein
VAEAGFVMMRTTLRSPGCLRCSTSYHGRSHDAWLRISFDPRIRSQDLESMCEDFYLGLLIATVSSLMLALQAHVPMSPMSFLPAEQGCSHPTVNEMVSIAPTRHTPMSLSP